VRPQLQQQLVQQLHLYLLVLSQLQRLLLLLRRRSQLVQRQQLPLFPLLLQQ